MILEKGNMWSAFGKGAFMITTNPIRRKVDGAVVMGRGIALEAKTRYPQLPYDFGKQLDRFPHLQSIGLIGRYDDVPIYYFMVKAHWAEKASLDIIKRSVEAMEYWGDIGDLYQQRIDLNFPGIGNGGLAREEVLPLLQCLPDNVHIWEFK